MEDMLIINLFNEIFNSSFQKTRSLKVPNYPPINIIKESNTGSWEVEVALTGRPKDSIIVDINGDILTIKSDYCGEEAKDISYAHNGFRLKPVDIQFRLQNIFDYSKTDVSYENGLLHIILPLKEENKPIKKTLEIK